MILRLHLRRNFLVCQFLEKMKNMVHMKWVIATAAVCLEMAKGAQPRHKVQGMMKMLNEKLPHKNKVHAAQGDSAAEQILKVAFDKMSSPIVQLV
jgi:hypothetical protein